jgi:hypothetical protein
VISRLWLARLLGPALGLLLSACSGLIYAAPSSTTTVAVSTVATVTLERLHTSSPSPTLVVAPTPTGTLDVRTATSTGTPTPSVGLSPYFVTRTAETATWATLHRPVRLPTLPPGTPCPRSATRQDVVPDFSTVGGDGPVYIRPWERGGLYDVDRRYPNRQGWFLQKVIFIVGPAYRGPILVRGHQLDGPTEIAFQEGLDTPVEREKRLHDPAGTSPTAGVRWWGGYTLWRAAGCYAIQLDGLDFSENIVFEVVYR